MPIEIYGDLDDDDKEELEQEIEYLEYLIKRYSKSPADIVFAKQKTKTKRYKRKAEESNKEYKKRNPYRTPP